LQPDALDTVISLVPPCPGISDLVMRCLAKEPEHRPQTMTEVEEVLGELEVELSRRSPSGLIPAEPGPDVAVSTRILRLAGVASPKRRWDRIIAGAAGLAAVGLLGLWAVDREAAPARSPLEAAAAAAPAVAPTPPPAPAPRAVTVTSAPPGAEVRDPQTQAVLGRTPWTVSLAADAAPRTVLVAQAGFHAQAVVLDPAGAPPAPVQLVPEPPAPAPARGRVARRPPRAVRAAEPASAPAPRSPRPDAVGRNGVIDPFAE
jgi:hypothetical protein